MIGGGCGESREGFFQPGPRIDAELLARGHEARQDRQATTAIIAAVEEPVLSSNREWLDGLSIRPSLFPLFLGFGWIDQASLSTVWSGAKHTNDRLREEEISSRRRLSSVSSAQ